LEVISALLWLVEISNVDVDAQVVGISIFAAGLEWHAHCEEHKQPEVVVAAKLAEAKVRSGQCDYQ
jgi:hypothetical protein